jgi:Holliday junction resolvase
MVNSRNKGASFEREVVKNLNEFFSQNNLDVTCKRNLDQYQQSGECDIPIPFHAVECKHYKEGNWLKSEWWRQVCDSAKDNEIPVLVFKFNRIPTRVCIPLHAINTDWEVDNQKIAVIPFEDWLDVLKKNWSIYEQTSES